MVKRFYFGETLAKAVEEQSAAHDDNIRVTMKSRIVAVLKEHGGEWGMKTCLDSIVGANAMKYDVRDELIKKDKAIRMAGVARSKTNPLRLILLKPDWTPSPVTVTVSAPSSVKSQDELKAELGDTQHFLNTAKKNAVAYPNYPHWRAEVPRLEQVIAELSARLEEGSCVN